jgi:hypothetical protein
MKRLWRWICVGGGFEGFRREGGAWAVLEMDLCLWWF